MRVPGRAPMERGLRNDGRETVSTKERILHIAEETFAEKGFEGTRTRDIAERAGINISTLHFHWKSKEELYSAVYQHLLAQRAESSNEMLALFDPPPTTRSQWEDTIRKLVEKLFAFFRVHQQAARLEAYWALEPHALSAELAQSQGGPLLTSVAERWRESFPTERARQLDVTLVILTANAIIRQYFTNPTTFRHFLGEANAKTPETRLKRHLRQVMTQLLLD